MASLIKLTPILDQLGKYGLPVRFIREAIEKVPVERGDEQQDELSGFWSKTLKLSPQTLDGLKNISPQPPFSESPAIQTLYHEATHAFFHSKREENNIKKLVSSGKSYYKNATLSGGIPVMDTNRVFMEAAAMYVAHRATIWWQILEQLTITESGIDYLEDKMYSQIVDFVNSAYQIPNKYNNFMAKMIFGYDQLGENQIYVSDKGIPGFLKAFCDTTLLEGKIPDRFDLIKVFLDKYKMILAKLKKFKQPPRSIK